MIEEIVPSTCDDSDDDYKKGIVSIMEGRRWKMESEEYINRKQQEAEVKERLVYSSPSPSW